MCVLLQSLLHDAEALLSNVMNSCFILDPAVSISCWRLAWKRQPRHYVSVDLEIMCHVCVQRCLI